MVNSMKINRIIIIIMDILAVGILIYQIINKDIYVPAFLLLIVSNILVFFSKEDDLNKK